MYDKDDCRIYNETFEHTILRRLEIIIIIIIS